MSVSLAAQRREDLQVAYLRDELAAGWELAWAPRYQGWVWWPRPGHAPHEGGPYPHEVALTVAQEGHGRIVRLEARGRVVLLLRSAAW